MVSDSAHDNDAASRQRFAAFVLIAEALLAVLTMLFHPEVTQVEPTEFVAEVVEHATSARWVHGLMMLFIVLNFFAVSEYGGVLRRRGVSPNFGIVFYLFGAIAFLLAATLSGFITTALAERYVEMSTAEQGGVPAHLANSGCRQSSFREKRHDRLRIDGACLGGCADSPSRRRTHGRNHRRRGRRCVDVWDPARNAAGRRAHDGSDRFALGLVPEYRDRLVEYRSKHRPGRASIAKGHRIAGNVRLRTPSRRAFRLRCPCRRLEARWLSPSRRGRETTRGRRRMWLSPLEPAVAFRAFPPSCRSRLRTRRVGI